MPRIMPMTYEYFTTSADEALEDYLNKHTRYDRHVPFVVIVSVLIRARLNTENVAQGQSLVYSIWISSKELRRKNIDTMHMDVFHNTSIGVDTIHEDVETYHRGINKDIRGWKDYLKINMYGFPREQQIDHQGLVRFMQSRGPAIVEAAHIIGVGP